MTTRTGWEHYELEKELRDSTIAELLVLYVREDTSYRALCQEYVRNVTKLTEEGRIEYEERCTLQKEAAEKIAVAIANALTGRTN